MTFLFTDIEGSTRLLRELGDGYAEVLAEHRRALRDAWQQHEGVEVDTQGDAFFVAFRACVRCGGGRRTRATRAYGRPSAGADGTAHRRAAPG